MNDHIHSRNVTRQTIEGVKVEPDGRHAVIIPLSPEGIAANTVEHHPYLPVVSLIINQQWAAIPELLECVSTCDRTSQLAHILDLNRRTGVLFQVPFEFVELKLRRRLYEPSFSHSSPRVCLLLSPA